MNIKTKLYLGIGFLFFVLFLLGGFGSQYIRLLSKDSKAILKDNYASIEYTRLMQEALDVINDHQVRYFMDAAASDGNTLYRQAKEKFIKNTKVEQSNITEIGERELSISIEENFNKLTELFEATAETQNHDQQIYTTRILPLYKTLRKEIDQVYGLNTQALLKKNVKAQHTAQTATFILEILWLISLIIAFVFMIYFPGYIANPLLQIANACEEISKKNYSKKLEIATNDEYGQVSAAFNKMVDRLNEYETSNLSKILFEKERIERIINNMADAIVGLDENKHVLFVNKMALSLLHLKEKDIIGKYAPDIASYNDLMRDFIKELMIDFDPWEKKEYPVLKVALEGKESYFSKDILDVSVPREGYEDHKLIGHVIILKNITQFREMDAAKTNFIATISHELKTPVSSIKMSLKLLEDKRVGTLNKEQYDLVESIEEDTQRLLKITGELLDLAQVETGNIQLHYQRISPADIIEYASRAMDFQASQRNITLETAVSDKLPFIQADLEKTTWVMVNLLSNAVRYSPESSNIKVTAKLKQNMVHFSVQDFGKGIEEKYQEKIFEKFFRIPDDEHFRKGTGLGLAIAKDFIETQGGILLVKSTLGEGSTFTFTLPVA